MPFLGKHEVESSSETQRLRNVSGDEGVTWTPKQPGSFGASQNAIRNSFSNTERLTCANLECRGGWKMPWRNRRRPIFESRWGCGSECLQVMVRRALKRERGDLHIASDEDAPHRHRVPLGLILLGQGWITQEQLRTALAAQRAAGEGRIGDWLMSACGLSSAVITRGLAAQWSCPVLALDGFSAGLMALTMPRLLVEELGLLPLRVAGSKILYVAFRDKLAAAAAFALEQMSGLDVVSGLLDDKQFSGAQGRLLESDFVTTETQRVSDVDKLAETITGILGKRQPVASRLVRIHQHYWLRTWLEHGTFSGVGRLPSSREDMTDTLFTVGSQA
jgi:hypothetical protein